VLAHCGAVAMPCRIQDPDRKGKVESGVGHAQKTPLKGLRFENLDEALSAGATAEVVQRNCPAKPRRHSGFLVQERL